MDWTLAGERAEALKLKPGEASRNQVWPFTYPRLLNRMSTLDVASICSIEVQE